MFTSSIYYTYQLEQNKRNSLWHILRVKRDTKTQQPIAVSKYKKNLPKSDADELLYMLERKKKK